MGTSPLQTTRRSGHFLSLTRVYVAKRTAEGPSKKEIIRCLKPYLAREIHQILHSLPLCGTPISAP